jgi:YfiH family protein
VFAFSQRRGPVDVAFTDRHGGVSGGPYASLNLAEPALDAPDRESDLAALEENLDIVAYALARGMVASPDDPFGLPAGAPLPTMVRIRQVHGNDVHVVDRAWLDGRHADPAVADALVTDLAGVALVVRVADCVPVLLADVQRGVVGAAHAGRPGLVAGIVPTTVAAMRDLGAAEITAWVGPHVCGACYEVPEQMRADVAAVVPQAHAETSWGTPSVDVGAGVRAQLAAAGVEVVDASRCTREDEDLYSYRRQGDEAGRLAGLVWVRP